MSVYHKDTIRTNHVLDATEQLIKLSADKSFEDFKLDIAFQLASIKLLETIGKPQITFLHPQETTLLTFPGNS